MEMVFSIYKGLTFIFMLRNNAVVRRCSYFELGLPVTTLALYMF